MKLTIGQKFKFLREHARRNELEIARRLSMQVSSYVKLENGEKDPTYTMIFRIARLYDLSVVELVSIGEIEEVKRLHLAEISFPDGKLVKIYDYQLSRELAELFTDPPEQENGRK